MTAKEKDLDAPYRELTAAAVVLGIIQGIVLNIAFVYAALQLGFSIGGSTVAAITGYALLRGVMRKGTIIENNINQTIASGINTAGTGIVFTLPALFMLDAKMRAEGGQGIDFSVWPLILGGIAGSILGVVLIIPLRKQMIELDRLQFPSGVAVATILKTGSSGMEKFRLLLIGVAVAALWKLVMVLGLLDVPGILMHEELNISLGFIPDQFSPVLYLSLMNVAAGLLASRGGLPFFVGGVLAWWIIAPLGVSFGWVPDVTEFNALANFKAGSISEGTPVFGYLYGVMIRPLGIGTLIGGALMGVVVSFPAIKSAIQSLANAAKTAKVGGSSVGGDELSLNVVIGGLIAAVCIFFVASIMTEGVSIEQAVVSSVVGTVWLGLAGLIVAQATGMTDISPMSGMALISVTLMMFLLNNNVAAAMVVGIAVCVAIGQGADMMQDLKTGFLIGGRPIKQQLIQFAVTWIGALVAIGAIYLLWARGPDGMGGFGEGTNLPAPQAGVLMGIIDGVLNGNIPIDKYALGGVVGILLGAAPMGGLGVLVGLAMYLPFSITLGYGIGCLISMFLVNRKGADFYQNKLVPLAAGLIVGEALMGVGYTIFELLKAGGGA
ncbi:MAG: OPT/YSL family transporter [Myxococcota bacterium]|nr:OPT/YSL family transporter [Myxococcota bacterium]